MFLYPSVKYEKVPLNDKKEGDPFFAEFNLTKQAIDQQQWEAYNKQFKEHRENMKISAKAILEFADKNQKEVMSDY